MDCCGCWAWAAARWWWVSPVCSARASFCGVCRGRRCVHCRDNSGLFVVVCRLWGVLVLLLFCCFVVFFCVWLLSRCSHCSWRPSRTRCRFSRARCSRSRPRSAPTSTPTPQGPRMRRGPCCCCLFVLVCVRWCVCGLFVL